jgi:hypothetical protein
VSPSQWDRQPPDAVPAVDRVLTLAPEDWRYHNGGRTLTIKVAGIRHDISPWYGGQWVWVEAHEVEHPNQEPPGHRVTVLVSVAAIPEAARDPQYQPDNEVLPR